MSHVRGEGIQVRIDRTDILHGVDIEASAGRFTAIIGPNGSGKTTLLRALTGELPCAGRAEINGLDVANTPAFVLAAQRAVLPQASDLAFPFTVFEVVRLGLASGLRLRGDETRRVSEALARVDLAGFGGRYYQALSGGEKQRVQLARVLVQVWEPVVEGTARFLFLDEPISSLDIRHQLQIMEIGRDFAARGGGVVAVLHDLNLAAAFADHVVLLENGRVAGRGTPADVLTSERLERVYGCPMIVGPPPSDMEFMILPRLPAPPSPDGGP